jgi:hypothetical protein
MPTVKGVPRKRCSMAKAGPILGWRSDGAPGSADHDPRRTEAGWK